MLKRIFLISFMLACIGFYSSLNAAGLSTTFSEVTLEDLYIGKTYSTKEVANLPLTVVNTGKEPVDLKIEILIPDKSELKAGFQPIPKLSWIKLEKEEFKGVKPNETATTDVIISIPKDKEYLDKNYQVFIWSHTVGRMIGIGLKSKLLIKIKGEGK